MWESLKEYIPLALHWSNEGRINYNNEIIPDLSPSCLFLEAGGKYEVDDFRLDGMLPSFASGGYGIRYTLRTGCDLEENYNKVYYIYFEQYEVLGRWRCGDKYVSADVIWDEKGRIVPTAIYLDDFRYDIGKGGILRMYSMSTRKTDGSGMRYLVRASCPRLRDYNREFALMLEHGGSVVGRWFYEDAEYVHKRKVRFQDLDDDSFDSTLIDESMGVSQVCARYQITINMAEFLRDWNSKDHNGVWVPPEVFERKIKDGIIYPKYYAPVMVDGEEKIESAVMRWGLNRSWTSNVLFNLRCDNLMKKDTFRQIKGNRCVVPSGGFYEYEKQDKKVVGDYLFRSSEGETLYMAGLYEPVDGERHYTILTTTANQSVDIHDRMPVVLRRNECKAWLAGKLDFADIENRGAIKLKKESA